MFIDPKVLAGLSKLGLNTAGQQPQLNKSDADSAALAWRERRQAALDATLAAAPPKEGIGRALLGTIIAGIVGGAAGGAEAGMPAMAEAERIGGALVGQRNEAAQADHAAKVAAAAKTLESYDDLTKGMRMILQAQPGLIPEDMMPLAAEIAFPGTGLKLQSKNAGIPASSQKIVDALDFILKSNDIKDPQELARLHNLRATLAGGLTKDQLLQPTSFIEGGLLNESWLIENAINGRHLAEKQNRGIRINIEDVDFKPKGRVSYDEATISALQRWAKVIVEQELPREDAFDQLDPVDQELLQQKFGGDRTGELDMTSAANLALRTLLKGGETQQAIAGGLGDESYWNNLLGEYLQKEKETQQQKLQDSVELQIEREQARLMQEEGFDEQDAEEQAVELVKKRLRKGGTWQRLDDTFRSQYGK